VPLDPALFRISAGGRFRLRGVDPAATPGFRGGKAEAQPLLERLTARLEELQELLHAEGQRRVLVVLQGLDTSGKDGVIRHVFEGVNPAGVRVASFKAPTAAELARDFLWRVHAEVPRSGEIAIFNRSHYEDVLVVRVKKLAPVAVWRRRYRQIVDFERLLAETGTTILKFFLHISREEQRERLQARIDDPTKRWKFRAADLEDRRLWPEYQTAYEAMVRRTSTRWAPWHVVPADKKWFRNLVVASALVDALEGLKLSYPRGEPGLDKIRVE
jgi:PPK2 family polyphosphate:nucleotide phosphotransferase